MILCVMIGVDLYTTGKLPKYKKKKNITNFHQI